MLTVAVCALAVFAFLMFSALLIHVLLYDTETGRVIDERIAEKLKGREHEKQSDER